MARKPYTAHCAGGGADGMSEGGVDGGAGDLKRAPSVAQGAPLILRDFQHGLEAARFFALEAFAKTLERQPARDESLEQTGPFAAYGQHVAHALLKITAV